MAESVDALVSNTSGAIRAGSIPAPGTRKWPTDTCRPFLYPIFPTSDNYLTKSFQIFLQFQHGTYYARIAEDNLLGFFDTESIEPLMEL